MEGDQCAPDGIELERFRFIHEVYTVAWRVLSPRQLQVLVSYLEEPALTCRERAGILRMRHAAIIQHRKRMLKRMADAVNPGG